MFSIRKIRYEFTGMEKLQLHHDIPAITFRGAFGYALAQVIARYMEIPELSDQVSLYKTIFMPQRDEDEEGGADLSRPFILRGKYSRTDRRSFLLDVHLFGTAGKYEKFFDSVMEVMAYAGIGRNNQNCRMEKIISMELPLADPEPQKYLSVEFLTPCARLKSAGNIFREELPFPVLFSRLADRVDELNRLYGDGSDSLTEGGTVELKYASRDILHRKISGGVYAASRTSGRTHQKMCLDGFLGEMAYMGGVHPFRTYLRYLPHINLGRFNVFGCGWCRMKYEQEIETSINQ